MEKEVGNATSACKVLHVLYTPPPAFCKPPTPIFFAKLAKLTSKHLFLSGSVNTPSRTRKICLHCRPQQHHQQSNIVPERKTVLAATNQQYNTPTSTTLSVIVAVDVGRKGVLNSQTWQ